MDGQEDACFQQTYSQQPFLQTSLFLHSAMVCHHLEYGVLAYAPGLILDITKMEK